jgi:hypothetical protein
MAEPTHPSCPYTRRLNEVMAPGPSPVIPDAEVALFRQLQALEVEAKAAGASRETLAAIANARSVIGAAGLGPWFGLPRGH